MITATSSADTLFDSTIDGAVTLFESAIDGLVAIFETAMQTAQDGMSTATNEANSDFDDAIDVANSVYDTAAQSAADSYQNSVDGLLSAWETAVSTAQGAYSGAVALATGVYDVAIAGAQTAHDAAVEAANRIYWAAVGPLTSAHAATIAGIDSDYQDGISDSANQYSTAMSGPQSTHATAVADANTKYNTDVAVYQQNQTNAVQPASEAFDEAEEEAADDYYDIANTFWATMSMMMGTFDMSEIYQAAKQYAVDVARANVDLTAATGSAAVQFTTDERAADTTRVQAINDAKHALGTAAAGASRDQKLRDIDLKEAMLTDKANENAAHAIAMQGHQATLDIAKANAKKDLDIARNGAEADLARATADAQRTLTQALASAAQAFADGEAGFAIAQSQALATAAEARTNAYALANADLWDAQAGANTAYALAASAAQSALATDMIPHQTGLFTSIGSAISARNNSVLSSQVAAFRSLDPTNPDHNTVADAWQTFYSTSSGAASTANSNDITALSTFLTSTATLGPDMSLALTQAAETYTNDGRGPYLAAVAAAASAQTTAINNIAPDALTAAIAANAAAKARVDSESNASHTFAHEAIDASQARADDAADQLNQFVVSAIPEGVTEFTSMTNAVRDRSVSKIGFAMQAKRDLAGPDYDHAIANLDAARTASNRAAAADDAVAVAAAAKAAADDVVAAWDHVNAVNARAAETFAGMAPGGMTMAVGGMMTGVGEWLGAVGSGIGQGISDGFWMTVNAATFHQFDSLDSYVDNAIAENGGAYGTANVFAHIGAWAGEAALSLLAIEYLAGQGIYQVSLHGAERMAERGIYKSMISWTVSAGTRISNLKNGAGLLQNASRFLTTAKYAVPALYHGKEGTMIVVRNIWTNNIITTLFTTR